MWELLAQHCGAAITAHGGLIGALFLAGLAGGATHCAGMCGPFVLAFAGARATAVIEPLSEWRRLRGAALVPYHLGRGTTYIALGMAAAMATGGLTQITGFRWIAALPLLLTAALFAAAAAGVAVPSLASTARGQFAGQAIAGVAAPLFRAPVGWRGYGAGVALGFLPCGLVYAAVAAAASTADWAAAAAGMAAFVLGTVPGLVAIAWLGDLAARRYRALARYVVPPVMAVNALVLSFLAWRMLA